MPRLFWILIILCVSHERKPHCSVQNESVCSSVGVGLSTRIIVSGDLFHDNAIRVRIPYLQTRARLVC